MKRVHIAALVLIVTTATCGDSPTGLVRDADANLQTDRLAYTVSIGGEPGSVSARVDIPYRLRNGGDEPWVLDDCPTPATHLQKLEATGAWRTVLVLGNYDRSECVGTTLVLQPGKGAEIVAQLRAGLPGQAILPTWAEAAPGGVYRLMLVELRRAGGAAPLPEAERISNRFELRPGDVHASSLR